MRFKLLTSGAAFLAAACMLALRGDPSQAAGLTYVDADDGFVSGTPNLAPLSAINSLSAAVDSQWGFREFAAGGSIFEVSGAEEVPEITQTITGLTPSASYDVYIVYWSANNANWTMQAGFSSGNHTVFNRLGPDGQFPSAVAGTHGSTGAWLSPPLDNPTTSNDALGIYAEGNRDMFLGKVGTMTASAGGEITVFLDDTDGPDRSWLDGLAYVEAGTPVFVSATIDRDTGMMSISNPTDSAFTFTGLTVSSPSGALDATQWTSISGNFDGNGNMTLDGDLWNVTAPDMMPYPTSTTQLAESEDASGSGGALLAMGTGTISLGDAWVRSAIEDVTITLTLPDSTSMVLRPTYTGAELASGDFDLDGDIDLGDFTTLLANLHTDVSALTGVQAYLAGDITGNGAINHNDFVAFRTAFDNMNGAGSFDAMAASVPEPSTFALCTGAIVFIGAAAMRRRRRSSVRLASAGVQTSSCGELPTTSYVEMHLMTDSLRGFSRTLAVLAVLAAATTASAAPVTGWALDPLLAGPGTVLSNAGTASPTLGNGSANNADNVAMYAAFPLASLGNGQQATLTFDATIIGSIAASGQFRYGLFDDDGVAPDTAGWLGYFALVPSATSSSTIVSKNPTGTNFATTTFASTASGRATTLVSATEPNGMPFADGTYSFSLTVSRFGNDAVVFGSVSGESGYSVNWAQAVENDPTRRTFELDRVGILAGGSSDTDQIQFNNIDVTVSPVPALTLEVNTTNGAVQIKNVAGLPFDMNYYEITSASGALNLGGWNSLDDQESGDPVGTGWDQAGGSAAGILSEVNLQAMSTLNDSDSLNLGSAFMVGGAEDLQFRFGLPDGTLLRGIVNYVATPGPMPDLNMDGKVDIFDVAIVSNNWANSGTPGTVTGDANKDGVVDIFDVALISNNWNPGGSASAVPEPASIALVLAFLPALYVLRRRQQLSS